jgi:hypothetical protein
VAGGRGMRRTTLATTARTTSGTTAVAGPSRSFVEGSASGLMLGSRGPAALGPDGPRGERRRGGSKVVDGAVGALLRAGARAPSPPGRSAAERRWRTRCGDRSTLRASSGGSADPFASGDGFAGGRETGRIHPETKSANTRSTWAGRPAGRPKRRRRAGCPAPASNADAAANDLGASGRRSNPAGPCRQARPPLPRTRRCLALVQGARPCLTAGSVRVPGFSWGRWRAIVPVGVAGRTCFGPGPVAETVYQFRAGLRSCAGVCDLGAAIRAEPPGAGRRRSSVVRL